MMRSLHRWLQPAAWAFLGAISALRAADWPTYRGDYARSGVSTQSLAAPPVAQVLPPAAQPPSARL